MSFLASLHGTDLSRPPPRYFDKMQKDGPRIATDLPLAVSVTVYSVQHRSESSPYCPTAHLESLSGCGREDGYTAAKVSTEASI